jgi:hypothetical protein
MRKLILLAGAAALAATAPVAAKPGHGPSHAKVAKVHTTVHDNTVVRTKTVHISDHDRTLARKYGGALCPPGLWKKTPSCMPPGQAKRLFHEGQRVPVRYRYITPYNDIPLVLRDRYDLDPDFRYIYRNNVIYTIDPATNLITSIINAVL